MVESGAILQYAHSPSERPLTASEALGHFQAQLAAGETATGLLYTPRECRTAKITSTAVLGPEGTAIKLYDVYELRAFGARFELRWLHEALGKGRAVILGEDAAKLLDGWVQHPQPYVDAIRDHRYLLWGTRVEKPAERHGQSDWTNWAVLYEPQVGELTVPVGWEKMPAKGRVALTAVEYLANAPGDDDGNVIVIEERLTGLVTAGESLSS